MSSNNSFTKKDTSLRRRKSVTAGAGVKHRLNCLSTLSALQSHSSSGPKRSRALCRTTSKPIKTMTKKSQDNYVIKLGSQQFMQQFTKSGSSVVVKEDGDQDPEANLTLQQKIKFFFVLLMIPSAMFVFFGSNKFNNQSSISIDPNVQLLGAMGGMGGLGGMAGMGGMGGLPRGFPGMGGYPGGHDPDPRRHHHHHHHERMRRDYDDYDPQSIEDHLERMGHRDHDRGHREHIERMRSRSKSQKSEPTQGSPESNTQKPTTPVPESNSHNEVNQQNTDKYSNSETNSESVKQNVENSEQMDRNHKSFGQNQNQNTDNREKIGMGEKNKWEWERLQESTSTSINSEKSNAFEEKSEFKSILLWTPIDGLIAGSQPFTDSKCVINKCIFTTNKSLISGCDAIVFDARHVTTGGLPNMRSPHQKWIFFSRHSPDSNSIQSLVPVSNLFNWSWTYRSDSDIVYNYANVKQMSVESNQLFKASDIFYIWRQKTKMILWFANDCHTNTKREDYVKQLKDYIDVDIYGKCSDNNNNIDIEDQNQMKSLSEKYLFVIAFEENNCRDYVSETLFKYLEHNMIPIVRGGADYSKIVPPNSVINAKDFTSAKDLADFVLDIGSDFQKYKKYFEWKRNHQISYERQDLCQLCYKLHEQHNTFKTNTDLFNWWLDNNNC